MILFLSFLLGSSLSFAGSFAGSFTGSFAGQWDADVINAFYNSTTVEKELFDLSAIPQADPVVVLLTQSASRTPTGCVNEELYEVRQSILSETEPKTTSVAAQIKVTATAQNCDENQVSAKAEFVKLIR